jgi:hypothetical protein
VLNIWVGVVNDFLSWPYLLPWQFSAEIYHMFLEKELSEMLEEITTTYKNHWIRRGRPMAWPPGSPTLHQCTSSYEDTLNLWFTCCQMILKRILLPILLK